MLADKEPETVGRNVNNGMLINFRENQWGHEQIQSSRRSNTEHIRHVAKTKKKQINNTEN